MKAKSLVIVERHTNTIFISETSARDIRKPKTTNANILFRHYKKLFPTATVVCLTDEEYYNRFHELEISPIDNFMAKNVLSNNYSEVPFMHFERIA